ncbi:MAG: ABC transporter permease, partial [bacterium]
MKNKVINKMKNFSVWADLLYSLFAIIVAFIIGAILIKISGYSVKTAYTTLFNGAFGSTYNFTQTLVKTIPLIFTGLAVAIGFQSGLLNIGVEGQLYWGAFVTTIIILVFPTLPALLLIPLGIIAGALAGGFWAAVPGYLKAKTGAHEVVTTIMFNYIATLGTTFLVTNYFKEAGPVDQTKKIVEKARLSELMTNTDLTWAIFVAIATVIVISYLLNKTSLGYDIKAVGKNASAAEYGGIDSN